MSESNRVADAQVDGALIARWLQGDQRAASAIVERHAQALARYAAAQGVRDAIDEIVQDTFVRAFNSLVMFRADSSLRTWLFTILKRLVLDRQRGERRRRQQVELEEGHAVQEFDALDGMVADEAMARVRAAVARLSPLQREVFTLRVSEGLPYTEIAKLVDSTEGACRVHYHNAMRAVKEFLTDD
ncbi:MAG: RNA polymerase sigma factor [Gemmatimonadaceae bacterium]|nr:RNA polymerase sigma factor [Gemmatimonadaceae bacterium]